MPESKDSPESAPRTARWIAPLETALVLAIFFLQAGWPAPDVNEPHYLGKARHYWDPGWAAGDFFFESADTHLVFYLTSGWPTRWLSLPAVAWLGRLLTWLWLAIAWRRLCQAVVGRPGWAALSAGLFLAFNVGCHLAGEWVVGGFEAKGLAYALVFAALAALVRGRWNVAFAVLGLASAFHVLVGGWSAIAVGLCWLLSRDRPPLVRLWPGIVGGAILALPGIVPALEINWGVESEIVAEANDIYVFRRLPHHLVPQSFRWPFIVRYLLMLFVWLGLVRRQRQCRLSLRERTSARPANGDMTPPKPSLRQSVAVGQTPVENTPLRRLNQFVIATLAISLSGMILSWITVNAPETQAALLRYYWFRLGDVMLPVGIALGAVANLARSRFQSPRSWRGLTGWLAICAALVVYGHGEYAAWTLFQNVPRADKAGKVLNHQDWREVCRWMSGHTPPHALAITPRMAQSFTWYADRGQVVSWKDLPQNARAVALWWRRLEEIYAMPYPEFQRRWHESLTELSPARLRKLGEKYGAGYLVVEAEPPIDLPCVYHNGSYAVYSLERLTK